jgi:hypothetical protein
MREYIQYSIRELWVFTRQPTSNSSLVAQDATALNQFGAEPPGDFDVNSMIKVYENSCRSG